MTKLTYNLHRAFTGLLLLVVVLAMANYYLDLGLFGRGRGAKGVLILAMSVGVVYWYFFAPTRQDMREHRDASSVTKKP
jgi:hypothetical protein